MTEPVASGDHAPQPAVAREPVTVVNPFLPQPSGAAAMLPTDQFVSAARFIVQCQGWSEGLGFSELAGFSSVVAHQEYSYNGMTGNVLTRQMGRASAPTITLKSALEKSAFAQMFAWHQLARMNNPLAKTPAMFAILDANKQPGLVCILTEAWCSKIEIDPAQAGSASVVSMKVTIECDSVVLA